jgi:Xaa-Pro aminopeptidase
MIQPGEPMDIHIDYVARTRKLREAMEARGIDLFLGTRGKSCNYIAGAFVPWRSVLLASREGYLALHTLIMDAERVKDDSWMENIVPCAPLPGAELWEVTVRKIRELGLERATIGVELGHSPRVINVPEVGGMRFEAPVRVTPSGGEMLSATPLELTVLEV